LETDNYLGTGQRYIVLVKLLKDISSINLKYEKLLEATESNFNIFSILRKESDEVALHSRFIGELLDPKGTHNRGQLFQQIFLQQIQGDKPEFKGSFSLYIERHMGKHGRIDLLLVGDDDVIVIENKIYADDQPKQLQRYKDAASDYYSSKSCQLYYLTLYGTGPSVNSLDSLSTDDVECISYKTLIKQWLELCAKEVYDFPILRETIVQYRKLIEKLTGQTLNEDQKVEIKELLFKGDNFKQALAIEEVITEAKIDLQKMVWNELKISLQDAGYEFTFVNYHFEEVNVDVCNGFYDAYKRSRFYGLQHKVLTFGEYDVHLYLEVEDCFYYGFTVIKNNKRGQFRAELLSMQPELKHQLESLVGSNENDEWWLAWKYSTDKVNFKNFNEGDTVKLGNPTFRQKWVEEVVTDVVELLKKCNEILAVTTVR